MKLIHICPTCGREHEKESTPEPSQLCDECYSRNMTPSIMLEIDIDCGNTPIQNDEKLWLEITIGDLLKERNMTIKNIRWSS